MGGGKGGDRIPWEIQGAKEMCLFDQAELEGDWEKRENRVGKYI